MKNIVPTNNYKYNVDGLVKMTVYSREYESMHYPSINRRQYANEMEARKFVNCNYFNQQQKFYQRHNGVGENDNSDNRNIVRIRQLYLSHISE